MANRKLIICLKAAMQLLNKSFKMFNLKYTHLLITMHMDHACMEFIATNVTVMKLKE